MYQLITVVLLCLVFMFGFTIIPHKHLYKWVKSLSAGVSVGYVFLISLPELNFQSEYIFISLLGGFLLYHILYTLIHHKHISCTYNTALHALVIATYSAVITPMILFLVSKRMIEGVILALLLVTHTVLSDFAAHKSHTYNHSIILHTIPIVGVIFGYVLYLINASIATILHPFAIGALFFISIKEEIPNPKNEKLVYFIIGACSIILMRVIIVFL